MLCDVPRAPGMVPDQFAHRCRCALLATNLDLLRLLSGNNKLFLILINLGAIALYVTFDIKILLRAEVQIDLSHYQIVSYIDYYLTQFNNIFFTRKIDINSINLVQFVNINDDKSTATWNLMFSAIRSVFKFHYPAIESWLPPLSMSVQEICQIH